MTRLHNPHPGEILKMEFLDEIGMSQNKLGASIGVPPNRIHAIVKGTRDITADTDLRLCKFFGLSEGYFLRLQNAYDTMEAKINIGSDLGQIVSLDTAWSVPKAPLPRTKTGQVMRACLDASSSGVPIRESLRKMAARKKAVPEKIKKRG